MHLGAHMSIAGGIHLACERGREVGCNVIQVFSKNQRQWNAKPLSADDIKLFRAATRKHKIRTAFAHGTYLINLASSDRGLWSKSGNAFVEELERCEELGLKFLITHPGSAGDKGETVAIRNMIRGLNDIHRRSRGFKTKVLLETTAGQGTTVGWKFEHMAAIREGLKDPERIGFCLDTCHIFAAGYDIRTGAGYDGVMEELDRILGTKSILAFHLNDSKNELGSRVDRHEHIGKGSIGVEAFRCLMNDRRFASVPKVLETPKEDDMDIQNLKLLRSL